MFLYTGVLSTALLVEAPQATAKLHGLTVVLQPAFNGLGWNTPDVALQFRGQIVLALLLQQADLLQHGTYNIITAQMCCEKLRRVARFEQPQHQLPCCDHDNP